MSTVKVSPGATQGNAERPQGGLEPNALGVARNIASVPGLHWDGGDRVEIDGQVFPCTLMIHPGGDLFAGPIWNNDPNCERGWSVVVPFESGVCAQVMLDTNPGTFRGITLTLYYPVWPDPIDPCRDEPFGVQRIRMDDGSVLYRPVQSLRHGFWHECEPDWVRETLERASRTASAPMPEGLPCGWVRSLDELEAAS